MADEQAALSNVSNEVLASAIQDYQRHVDKVKAAQLSARACINRWDERGVNKGALKDAVKFRGKDETEFKTQMSQFLRFRAVDGYGEDVQSLFSGLDMSPLGEEAAGRHKEAQAYDIGYQVAMDGGATDSNSFAPGSPFFVAWAQGWRDGAAILQSTLPDKTEMADGRKERRGPGRPRKEQTAPAAAAAAPTAGGPPPPMWDDDAQTEAQQVASRMDAINAGDDDEEGEGEEGLGVPEPAAMSAPPAKPRGRARKPSAVH